MADLSRNSRDVNRLVLPPEFMIAQDANSINDRPREEIKFVVVNDSNHPDVKKAILTDDLLTIYIPDGWKVIEVFDDNIYNGIANGVSIWGVSEVCATTVDSAEQRTCSYFTADKREFEEGGVEVADAFRFYRPSNNCSCSHPDAIARAGQTNPPCSFASAQSNCSIYKAQEWTPIRLVKGTKNDGSETLVALEKNRKGYGVPVYRATKDGVEDTGLGSPELFDGVLEEYEAREEQPLSEVIPRNSFLEFVLGEAPDVGVLIK